MENATQQVTISAVINAPVDKVWKQWTTPADIMN